MQLEFNFPEGLVKDQLERCLGQAKTWEIFFSLTDLKSREPLDELIALQRSLSQIIYDGR